MSGAIAAPSPDALGRGWCSPCSALLQGCLSKQLYSLLSTDCRTHFSPWPHSRYTGGLPPWASELEFPGKGLHHLFIHLLLTSQVVVTSKWKSLSHVRLFVTHGLHSPWNSPGQNTGVGSPPFSRGSSQPRVQIQVSHVAGGFFTSWATREAGLWHEAKTKCQWCTCGV